MRLSASYHLFSVFVARGLFRRRFPLAGAVPEQVVETRDEARHFFVFCAMEGDAFLNALLAGSQWVSMCTRILTGRMGIHSGLHPRGAHAHRHAAGTNTTARVLLRNNGMAVGRAHL
eukprot:14817-Chlamydomonas_euryale.AAC.1